MRSMAMLAVLGICAVWSASAEAGVICRERCGYYGCRQICRTYHSEVGPFWAYEPPPNEWTPVVGSESQEVSHGRSSTSVIYGGLQAPGRRASGVERPFDYVCGEGTRSSRLGAAALGGAVRAAADIGGAAPHHAGDADVCGPGIGDRPAAPGERTAAHG